LWDDLASLVGRRVVPVLATACVGAALSLDPSLGSPALAEEQQQPPQQTAILRFPASKNPEVFEAQKTLVKSWAIVSRNYIGAFDYGFSKRWERELSEALSRTTKDAETDDVEAAYGEIDAMLSATGDPYTRFVSPREFKDFRVKNDGELQGVGLLIASDPSSGRLVVLSPIQGGPAERAGILPGDEISAINGRPTRGITGEMASAILRGRHGTSVTVKLARRSDQIPGVPGRPEYRGEREKVRWRQVKLVRDSILINPVQSELTEDGGETGYIKLSSFNQRSSEEMERAILDLKSEGARRFILDLRDNPGGLVNAGLEVASMWLEPRSTVLHTVTQDGGGQTVRLPGDLVPLDSDDPLVVLVNKNSASASEILAGALKDNGRAELLGENAKTFGKGKIQSVFELGEGGEGGAVIVTVAKYQTPAHRNIDAVGIEPDKICGAPVEQQQVGFAGTGIFTADIRSDPCVIEAEIFFRDSEA